MKWVRRKTSDTWHFVKACRHFPRRGSPRIVAAAKPKHGEFCNECRAKARRRARA